MVSQALVWFEHPVPGVDPLDGATVIANRHRVIAESAVHRPEETVFLSADGEVVARWETTSIARIQWVDLSGPAQGPRGVGTPGVGTTAWRELISKENPRAYERWTREEDARLADEFTGGLSVADIARLHQRRPGGIAARLKHLGLAE